METKEIEIKDIKEVVFERTETDKKDIQRLGENILENGQLQPIRVAPLESGGYNLIYGSQRLEACKICNIPLIRADVLEEPIGETQAMILNTIENGQRQNLNLFDTFRQVEKLIELGIKKGDIARLHRRANSWVTDIQKIKDMPTDIINAIKKGEIGIAQIRELSAIPDKKKIEILPQIRNSTVKKTVQEIAEQHRLSKVEIDLNKVNDDLEYYNEKLQESKTAEGERDKVKAKIERLKIEHKKIIKQLKTIDKKGELDKLLQSIATLDNKYYPVVRGIEQVEEKIKSLKAESSKLQYDEEKFKQLETENVRLISQKADLTQKLNDVNSKLGANKARYNKIKAVVKEIETLNKEIEKQTKFTEKQRKKVSDIEEEHKTTIAHIDNKRTEAKKFKKELDRNNEIALEMIKLAKEEGQLRGKANNKKAHEEKIEKLNVQLRGLKAELKKTELEKPTENTTAQ
jgi:ParB-like chromosome segregation protein Spo0J